MKKLMSKVVVMAAVLGAWTTGWSAINFVGSAGSYSATWSGTPTAIPDYPGSGLAFELNFTDADYPHITAVSVTFTTSGGWNGDLYAYLSHGDGIAILLNRVGANSLGEDGYGTSGFNTITLSSDGVGDIHTIAAPTSVDGPYEADGRWDYTSGTRDNTLGVFAPGNALGAWTLFFSDEAGLNTSTLQSWEVEITSVPEPVSVALGVFGGLMGIVILARSMPVRRFLLGRNVKG